jgi:hypothetical protein
VVVAFALFTLLTSAVEAWRWSAGRRRRMHSVESAAVGPPVVVRSITQDAVAHTGAAAVLGSVIGVAFGWAWRGVSVAQVPYPLIVALVLATSTAAAIGARIGTADR